MVERVHRNLKSNLTAIMKSYAAAHKHWVEYLKVVVFKYNASYHLAINASPASVFLGRELATTCDVVLRLDNVIKLDEVAKPGEIVAAVSKAHLLLKQAKNALPKQRYSIGQLVWRESAPSASSTTKDAKFADKYDGPFRILDFSTS